MLLASGTFQQPVAAAWFQVMSDPALHLRSAIARCVLLL
jgi:hypothetical protein